jgi:NAD(P)-dependent dehydrogenase (short-subunit alcohol dehydrogenase family)
MKTVLILGATGVFGRRLAANLARERGLKIVLASRQLAKAEALMTELQKDHQQTEFVAITLYRSQVADVLASLRPWLVVDASGPFQGLNYDVPKSALAAGCHFIDLADARDYMLGFSAALNDLAKSKGLVALAGASSSPALSSAVVTELTKGWKRVDTIDMAITPDGIGDVGEAVVRGVLSYAGKPVPQFRFGKINDVKGWMRGHTLAVPKLGSRWVAPVETVETDIFARQFNVQSRIAFFAGLQSRLEMFGIALLARCRSTGLFEDMSVFVKPMQAGRKLTRKFAHGNGGMVVKIAGLNALGQWSHATWSLLASEGRGLNVPGLPAVAAVRMMIKDELLPGARIAYGEIPLALIEAEFAPHQVTTEHCVVTPQSFIFRNALSPNDMAALPKIIAEFHSPEAFPIWEGEAQIQRSGNLVSRLVGSIIGLPNANARATVKVTVERDVDGNERWTRCFDGKNFHSTMNRGTDGGFWERFGFLNFKIDLRVENEKLIYPISKARCCGVPIPRFLLPTTNAFETVDEQGRFVFDVLITLPIVGRLVHYRGWLEPKGKS